MVYLNLKGVKKMKYAYKNWNLKKILKSLKLKKYNKPNATTISRTLTNMNPSKVTSLFKRNILDILSFKKIFTIYLSIIITFGFLFFLMGSFSPDNGLRGFSPISGGDFLINSIYFSFITATSTGFGDITPLGISRFFAVTEVISAMSLFGIALSKLVSVKQDKIIGEIYEISLDEKVNRIRSGFHMSKSDITSLSEKISDSRVTKKCIETVWAPISSLNENLLDASKLVCSSNKHENDFIKTVGHMQLELILSSVKSSLVKVNDLVSQLNSLPVNWKSEKNMESLKIMLSNLENICDYHRIGYPSPKILNRIDEIEGIKNEVEKRMSVVTPAQISAVAASSRAERYMM